MFEGLGVNWTGTLLGCVALILVPVPIWFYMKGEKIREKSAFAPTLPTKTENESSSDGQV